MEWTRSETLALAAQQCTLCFGLGMRLVRLGKSEPCYCVQRSVFRLCYSKYRRCAEECLYGNPVRHSRPTPNARNVWSFTNEDFALDFELIARRALKDRPIDLQVFNLHFVRGGDWKVCTRALKIDRGDFFHAVYRAEQIAGRAMRETLPFPLYPIDEYFNSSKKVRVPRLKLHQKPQPLCPPLIVNNTLGSLEKAIKKLWPDSVTINKSVKESLMPANDGAQVHSAQYQIAEEFFNKKISPPGPRESAALPPSELEAA